MSSDKVQDITMSIEKEWGEIVFTIVDEAERRFKEAGSPDDFCIQHCNGWVIIFGGYNRVKWSAKDGFTLDENYCSPKFIEKWKKNS